MKKKKADLLQQVLATNPPLGEAILGNNVAYVKSFLEQQAHAREAQERERQRRIRLMNMDPLSMEYQKAIEGY